MKGNKHMKTKTHLKSPSRRQFPSLALLFAAVTLLAFAPQPVRAGPSYPFHAKFITEFESVLKFPYLHYTVNAQGQATYMNRPSAHTDDQIVNLIDGSLTATYTLTPASRMADGWVRPIQDTLVLALVRSRWRHDQYAWRESFSPAATQSPEAPVDSLRRPAAAFLGVRASILTSHQWYRRVCRRGRNHLRTGGLKQRGIDPGPNSIPGPGSEQDTPLLAPEHEPHNSRTLPCAWRLLSCS